MSTPTPAGGAEAPRRKTTVLTFQEKKDRRERIAMLTAYDYPTAQALDRAGVDSILVGDSLGMVVLGYETTLPVTMEDMLHHCRAVARGARSALLVGDLPFLSYQVSVAEAVRNAGALLQQGGMDAVKLEGGRERLAAVAAIAAAGIPVIGHLGLTPQSIRQLGGFRLQGRTAPAAVRLVEDALALEQAGCFSLVLESVPARLAGEITRRLRIPTIGIGAGPLCDGQVLVLHDLLGLFDRFTPRFARRYAELDAEIRSSVAAYIADVKAGVFPAGEHSSEMPDEEWERFSQELPGGPGS